MTTQEKTANTILVVDDQPDNLRVLTAYLKRSGFSIRVALTGEKALELAEQFPPDLILLDIMMPGIDGFETCQRLKDNPNTHAIPVIFMTALSDTVNKVKGFEVGGVDYITKPLQHEEVLARIHTHLTIQNLQQELQQKNEKLSQLNTQLQDLNASKDKFFSIISHDLQSPFTGLLGITQLLVEHIDTYTKDELENILIKVRDSTEKLYELLSNLLTWSRIQQGSIDYQPRPLNIHDIVTNNIRLLTTTADQKQIRLTTAIVSPLWVYADANMIDTVLRNLITNALKFTHAEGQITVTATAHPEDPTVEIAVTDTGVGMSADQIAKLFRIDKKYQRLGTAGEKGTGLGLILCKEFVEKNGGTLWVESEVDHGTTFRFTLPAASS